MNRKRLARALRILGNADGRYGWELHGLPSDTPESLAEHIADVYDQLGAPDLRAVGWSRPRPIVDARARSTRMHDL